jgi:Fuc2NAc and GlcNAc transferase
MGDVGSGALGFLLAALPVATIDHGPAQLWPWVIAWGAFLADSTVTLVRRLARGARPYEAHRTHAYQALSRRWRSHGRVTSIFVAVNLLWLAPLAVLAARQPARAMAVAALALLPLFVWVERCGAGRPDRDDG